MLFRLLLALLVMLAGAAPFDAHRVLGIPRGSLPEAVHAAYRRAALKHHPDRPGGDAAAFRLARRAYEELSEEAQKRARASRGGPAGAGFGRSSERGGDDEEDDADYGDGPDWEAEAERRRAEEAERDARSRLPDDAALRAWLAANAQSPRALLVCAEDEGGGGDGAAAAECRLLRAEAGFWLSWAGAGADLLTASPALGAQLARRLWASPPFILGFTRGCVAVGCAHAQPLRPGAAWPWKNRDAVRNAAEREFAQRLAAGRAGASPLTRAALLCVVAAVAALAAAERVAVSPAAARLAARGASLHRRLRGRSALAAAAAVKPPSHPACFAALPLTPELAATLPSALPGQRQRRSGGPGALLAFWRPPPCPASGRGPLLLTLLLPPAGAPAEGADADRAAFEAAAPAVAAAHLSLAPAGQPQPQPRPLFLLVPVDSHPAWAGLWRREAAALPGLGAAAPLLAWTADRLLCARVALRPRDKQTAHRLGRLLAADGAAAVWAPAPAGWPPLIASALG